MAHTREDCEAVDDGLKSVGCLFELLLSDPEMPERLRKYVAVVYAATPTPLRQQMLIGVGEERDRQAAREKF